MSKLCYVRFLWDFLGNWFPFFFLKYLVRNLARVVGRKKINFFFWVEGCDVIAIEMMT